MKLLALIGKPAIWFDRFCNWTIGKWNKVWSSWGGNKNETISHTLGLEEAERLWNLHKVFGNAVFGMEDIPIDKEHLLGEFSSDLCDFFQAWHALRSINWNRTNAKMLCQKYPGIKELVAQFLEHKGVKE